MRATEPLTAIQSPSARRNGASHTGTRTGFARIPDRSALLDLKSCPRCVTGPRLYDPYFGEWSCLDCGNVTYDSVPETERKRLETLVRHTSRDDLDPLVIIPTASKHQHIGTARCPWCWEAFGVERWMKAKGPQGNADSRGEVARWRCDLGHFISLIEKPGANHTYSEWLWQ